MPLSIIKQIQLHKVSDTSSWLSMSQDNPTPSNLRAPISSGFDFFNSPSTAQLYPNLHNVSFWVTTTQSWVASCASGCSWHLSHDNMLAFTSPWPGESQSPRIWQFGKCSKALMLGMSRSQRFVTITWARSCLRILARGGHGTCTK